MSVSSSRSLPRVPLKVLLPMVLLTGAAVTLAWLLSAGRAGNEALKAELTTLRVAGREAASRGGLAADALRRAARLEEALVVMRRGPPAPAQATDVERTVELERVIVFLREEIRAAHETIERLKQEEPARRSAKR